MSLPPDDYSWEPFDREIPPDGHPLLELGALLTNMTDEDEWATCEDLILDAFEKEKRLIAAARLLIENAEEYEGPDGMMFAVTPDMLHELEEALGEAPPEEE